MSLFDINFPELLKTIGDFYVIVVTAATGAIVALMIQTSYNKLNDRTLKGLFLTKEGLKFVLSTLFKSFIVSTVILLIIWILSKVGLLIGTIRI